MIANNLIKKTRFRTANQINTKQNREKEMNDKIKKIPERKFLKKKFQKVNKIQTIKNG